jgi:hypothetical protein
MTGVIPAVRFNPWLLVPGIAVAFAPGSLLASVASTQWEIDLLRYCAAAVVGLAVLWPWAMQRGGAPARRLRSWTALAALGAGLYLVDDQQLYLIIAFSCLVAGVLNGGMERAVASSDALREELERRNE